MAVYTTLDEVALRALVSVYDDQAELVRADGVAAGSINTTYRLETDRGAWFLRINEGKSTDDVFAERAVLRALGGAALGGVVVPAIVPTRIGGSFYLLEMRAGRPVWATVFAELPGRDLAPFEIGAGHAVQIGAFLARAHLALRCVRLRRPNPYGLPVVARFVDELLQSPVTAELGARLAAELAVLRRGRRLLPRGVVHGDLFPNNTKWLREQLVAVFDWEMAGTDHLALDLGIALCAWCWRQAERAFDATLCRALVQGYREVRPLAPSERRGLYLETQLAALRFTASRARDFELPRPEREHATRDRLDYRDFLARLEALQAMRRRGFAALIGLAQGSHREAT
ncbi:MAG: homoserine kinase [Deltaproteobacteria bacterium]|nr:homoserine kinase [Deltaproteobacteria bacterium]